MFTRPARSVLLTALLGLALFAAPLALDVPSAVAEEKLRMQFDDEPIELDTFLVQLQKVTGYPILWNPQDSSIRGRKITGRVSLVGTPAEIFSAARALLTFYELVCIPVGPTSHKILLIMGSRQTSSILKLKPEHVKLTNENLLHYDQQDGLFVTTTIEVKHMRDLRGARNALTRLVTAQNIGQVTEVPGANAFIVTDFAPNVVAIYRLIKTMDRPSASSSTTAGTTVSITLEHAKATEVAVTVRALYAAPAAPARTNARAPQASGPSAPRVVADERTNRLLVTGTDDEIAKVREAVALLDLRIYPTQMSVALIRLKHIRAEEAAGSLNDLVRSSAGLWRTGSSATPPTIVSHNETNALLVSAAESKVVAAIRALVAEMDKETE